MRLGLAAGAAATLACAGSSLLAPSQCEPATLFSVLHHVDEKLSRIEDSVASTIAAQHADAAAGQRVHRIVLTGGPCGGKSTALATLRARFENQGYVVICVPEAATMLFTAGARVPTSETVGAFQDSLMKSQLSTEAALMKLAASYNAPVVLLMDRGLMDAKAYMSDAQFEQLLAQNRMDVTAARDHRYDMVVHLVSAAIGAENFYSSANNPTRFEGLAEAQRQDRATLRAWTGHSHVEVIDNSTDFGSKMDRVVNAIEHHMGLAADSGGSSQHRKWLLRAPIPTPAQIRALGIHVEEFKLEQRYLVAPTPGNAEQFIVRQRLRKRSQKRSPTPESQATWNGQRQSLHTLQVWTRRADGSVAMNEQQLSARDYQAMAVLTDPETEVTHKHLCTFVHGNLHLELNNFADGNCVLEVEADTKTVFDDFPAFLHQAVEITNDPRYNSYERARK